jgi:hypothetical protein
MRTKLTIERNQWGGAAGEDYDLIWATKSGALCPLCLRRDDDSPAARWLRSLLDGEGEQAMTPEEFVAESKRLQAQYDRTRRINLICAVVMLIFAALALLAVLAACQMPLRQ